MRDLFIRWIIKGSIFAMLITTTCASLLVLLPVDQSSYLAAIHDKHRLLDSTPGSRVIVVGGSNVAFGIDSERLADLLHKPAVNDGLHAGLGMRLILNDLEPFIHPGDIVVLMPEYPNFFNNGLEGNTETLALLLEVYPQAVQSFDTPQYIKLLDPDMYITKLRYRLPRLADRLIFPPGGENPIYSRAAFNRYGDVISHLGEPSDPNIDSSAYINEGDSYDPTTVDVFNQFAKQTRAKGATVYLVFPASRNTNCIATQLRFEQLDDYLRNRLEFPVLSHPVDSCFADELFFDTKYHLTAEGRQLQSMQLAKLLINQNVSDIDPGGCCSDK